MRIINFLLLLSISCVGFTQKEQLIVFAQKHMDVCFTQAHLPDIRSFAASEDIEFIERDITEGLPPEITTTPAIIFQNGKGRSIYAGRYAELNTIQNFVRTARLRATQTVNLQRQNIFLWADGRAKIAVSVKLTSLIGPELHQVDTIGFYARALQAMEKRMQLFQWTRTVELKRTDRSFYLDLHPYINEEGQLFLGMAIFSQFNCITPLFQNFEQIMPGPFATFEQLFERVGEQLERLIQEQLKQSTIGDAYSAIPASIPAVSWKTIGLSLPALEENKYCAISSDQSLPKNWEYAGAIDAKIPTVQFRFMEPLERYSGEMRKMQGNLKLNNEGLIESGYFEVDTRSMTMGMESLDKKVLKSYLKAKRFPKSSFRFINTQGLNTLRWGMTSSLAIEGIFYLMKYKKRIVVKAMITPLVDELGNPLLSVQANFELNITDDFGIAGPDGPDPAKKMLLFNLNFLMKGKNNSSIKNN